MPDQKELNPGISFQSLQEDLQKTFSATMAPVPVRFEAGDEVYKWTEYPLVTVKRETGIERITPFWNTWKELRFGELVVPGFAELRTRYRNIDGGVGQPQEFARARSSVTVQWNDMSAITKARFIGGAVWGILGKARYQRLSLDEKHPRHLDNVFTIGGDFQICIPNLTRRWIKTD